MKAILLFIIMLLSVSFFVGCDQKTDREKFESTIDSFAYYYFNSQYPHAIPYVTPESKKWLEYASSQITQADIDILRALPEGASYEIGVNSYHENDTTASVEIVANNVLVLDTIGGGGKIVPETKHAFELRKRKGKWLVHLTEL